MTRLDVAVFCAWACESAERGSFLDAGAWLCEADIRAASVRTTLAERAAVCAAVDDVRFFLRLWEGVRLGTEAV